MVLWRHLHLQGTFICNGWGCPIKWHPFALLSFPMSSLDQLGAISEKWFCHGNGSAGKHQSTTLGSRLHFLASKGTKTTATQAASHATRVQTTVNNSYTKCLGPPATRTWQSCTENYLETGLDLIPGTRTAMGHSRIHRIKMAIHVNPGSPWRIHLWICLFALCQLDARMHAWMDGLTDGWTDAADGWIRASTAHTWWDTSESPLLLFAEGSAAGKGTGSNLQHPVAISPWSLIALARTSKQTTTCHVMSHLSESIRICQNLSSTTPPTAIGSNQNNKTDNPNNY